jgi:amino acid transporter
MITPPPLPTVENPAPPLRPVPAALIVALCVVGPLAVLLAWFASGVSRPDAGLSYRIGYALGGPTLLPLIAAALFVIGRRFRTARAQAVIVLCAWLFTILGSLGTLSVSAGLSLANNGS